MSYSRNYGRSRLYHEEYDSNQMEYSGYDPTWVLGVHTAAAPYVHDRAYSSSGGYYGSSYGSKYPPRNLDYRSSYSSNPGMYPHRHEPQPSLLTQLFPSRRHTYSTAKSGYPDEVKLKVEICCLDCRNKMMDILRNTSGVYDVRVEGSVHAMVTVMGKDLKPKKILKKVRKIIKAADYWSDWHYSDGVAPHRSQFLAPPSYSPSRLVRHKMY